MSNNKIQCMIQYIENDREIRKIILEIWNKFMYLISLKRNNIYIQ